jgi:glycosyltransferase involved in cell wall biosynthesis
MVIATYAPDEPIRAILAAAAAVGLNFRFYITGNDRKLSAADRKIVPENVCLTGFLAEADYWGLMDRCHLVLDLSLMPDCVVCGAYEALAMGRPMILSDNAAIRELFGSVAVVTSGEAVDIERALLTARERYESLARAVPAARDLFQNSWLTKAELLKGSLSRL